MLYAQLNNNIPVIQAFTQSETVCIYCFFILVPPVLAHEDNGMAMGWETVAGEVDVVADALRAIAVVAHAV